jgi:hypothetical protein
LGGTKHFQVKRKKSKHGETPGPFTTPQGDKIYFLQEMADTHGIKKDGTKTQLLK